MSPIMTVEKVREGQRRYRSTIEWLHKYDENTMPPVVRAPIMKTRAAAIQYLRQEILILDKVTDRIEAGDTMMILS